MAAWEQQVKQPTAWTPLDPVELSSTNGAKLAKQPDLSVVASGPNGKTTYKFVARTDLANVTGVRLEALADERLPVKGPGRSGSGNFVLTEFRVESAPKGEPSKNRPSRCKTPRPTSARTATTSRPPSTARKPRPTTAGPFTRSPARITTAAFETKDNAGSGPGLFTVLVGSRVPRQQAHAGPVPDLGDDGPRPVTLQGLPQNITDLLAVAADKRTDAQKAELLKFYRARTAN